jgi:hypothetical protein
MLSKDNKKYGENVYPIKKKSIRLNQVQKKTAKIAVFLMF